MRTLVLTLAIGPDYQRIAALTHPTLRTYAARIGADFHAILEPTIATTTAHWEKFQIADFLDHYDRVLYLDTDVIVREDTPNLFDLVPVDRLGAFNEAPFAPRSRELLIDVCRQYGVTLPGWDGRYFNTGVLVVSKGQQPLFRKPDLEVCNFYEQTYLNMKIAEVGAPVHELPYQYNRMTCLDRATGEDRAAAFIIHYAGFGYHISIDNLLALVRTDLRRWQLAQGDHRYRRHICVSVTGGLGDQLAAEPAVRFMREELYPTDEFIVVSHWPRIYHHFNGLGAYVYPQGGITFQPDTPYFHTTTLPDPQTLQWRVVSHLLCHTVDYAAMALMHRTLPHHRRTIRFDLTDYDTTLLAARTRDFPVDRAVVVHPGKHWNTKTFPVAWWQEVIDGLVRTGQPVIVVGKEEVGDPPTYSAGARGTVDVVCPPGVLDLRDRLPLGPFAALLARAPVLVSNDSAPVHLAGAFDNHIVLVPSCKHPDHILPWRHGSITYKARALYQRLVIDDVEARPTQLEETSADLPWVDWSRYLPDPLAVVDAATEVLP